MAKLMQDGFEYITAGSPSTDMTTLGNWAQAAVTRVSGRFGGSTYAINRGGSGANQDTLASCPVFLLSTNYSRLIGGVSFQANGTPNSPTNTGRILSLINASAGTMNNAAQIQVGIGLDVTNTAIVVYRGTTEIGRSSNGVFSLATWYRLEWDVTFNDTTGSVTVRLDGTPVVTLTNVDTNNGLSNQANGIRLNGIQQSNGGLNVSWDDLVVMDATGTRLNGFLGDVRIDRLAPTSDVQAQFTRVGAGLTANFDAVDESGIDATNYLESDGGETDIFGLADLASTTEILGITTRVRTLRTGTTVYNLTLGLQPGAGEPVNNHSPIATVASATSYALHMDTNPTTGVPWTPSEIDALRLHMAASV